MKATLFQTSGYSIPMEPKKGKSFSLDELQAFVGGRIAIQRLPKGGSMVLNEEGELLKLPPNTEATKIWKRNFPDSKFPINNPTDIYGDVLVCDGRFLR